MESSQQANGKGGRGGGRGGKGKDREPPSREVQISKKLSWLLRHGATAENLAMDAAGYANLADVLNNRKLKGMKISFDEVRGVVDSNEKQRFGMKVAEGKEETSVKAGDWLIRANQGHSIEVESEGLLQPITLDMEGGLPEMVVHGTTRQAWTLIVESGGLKRMNRNHIHFAAGLPETFKPLQSSAAASADTETSTAETAAAPVISGMRSTSTILVYLDLPKALEAGIKFWRSENGVILSAGDDGEGKVGMQFFKRVEDRKGMGVLVEEGKVVQEAPAAWKPKGEGKGRR